MKLNYLKRGSALLMSIMMAMVFTIASTTEAGAASTKSFQVVSTVTTNYSSSYDFGDGPSNQSGSSKITYAYNKNGLMSSRKTPNGVTKISKRNAKGYVTQEKLYDKNGKLSGVFDYKVNKNGDTVTAKMYNVVNGKKQLDSTTTYKWYSKGKTRQSKTVYANKSVFVMYYDKNGNITKDTYNNGKSGSNKYVSSTTYKNSNLKKGMPQKVTGTETTTFGSDTEKKTFTTTNKYTFKNGRVTKIVSNTTYKKNGKVDRTEKSTTTNSYNKNGKMLKSENSSLSVEGSYKHSYKSTTKYTYKNVKVAKKYWHLYK